MFKKTIIAIAALGIIGAASLTPTAPAEAFFVCAKNAKHKQTKWCERRAERKAKWEEFWQSLFGKHKKRG